MIEGRAETLEEWYNMLQDTYDKYNVLINNLEVPEKTPENEDTYEDQLTAYKKKRDMYLENQKPSKYYLDQRNVS